jgi:hypothetical protein
MELSSLIRAHNFPSRNAWVKIGPNIWGQPYMEVQSMWCPLQMGWAGGRSQIWPLHVGWWSMRRGYNWTPPTNHIMCTIWGGNNAVTADKTMVRPRVVFSRCASHWHSRSNPLLLSPTLVEVRVLLCIRRRTPRMREACKTAEYAVSTKRPPANCKICLL